MLRAVIFDFRGVLLRVGEPEGRRAWEARLSLKPGELDMLIHGSDLWISAAQGQIGPEEYWDKVAERLGIARQEIPALRADFFRDEALDQELIGLVKSLRNDDYSIGLLANDLPTLGETLADLGIAELFDAVTISALAGAMKPDPAAFRAAASALELSVAECAFIDDNTANVDGARGVGMQALLYRPGLDVGAALRQVLEAHAAPTRAIIFDFGNVLDIPQDWEAWYAMRDALAADYGVTGEDLSALIHASEAWAQVKVGAISYDQYRKMISDALGIPHADPVLDAYYTGREHIHPDMLAILHELKPRYRLALLSNAWQLDMERWLREKHGLDSMFEVVVSSAAVGLAKPDPAIYRLALERLGLSPGEALFIDDLARNTATAEAIGLPSVVFESPAKLRRALAVRGLL